MARVTTQKSRKEWKCGGCGRTINKGDMYKRVEMKTGPTSSITKIRCSSCQFKRSELTTSEYKQALYDIQDSVENINSQEDIDNLVSEIESLADETRDKFDNMPEGLQQGDTGQMLESRADSLDSAKSDIEDLTWPDEDKAKEEIDEDDYDDEDEYNEAVQDKLTELEDEVRNDIQGYVDDIEE